MSAPSWESRQLQRLLGNALANRVVARAPHAPVAERALWRLDMAIAIDQLKHSGLEHTQPISTTCGYPSDIASKIDIQALQVWAD